MPCGHHETHHTKVRLDFSDQYSITPVVYSENANPEECVWYFGLNIEKYSIKFEIFVLKSDLFNPCSFLFYYGYLN